MIDRFFLLRTDPPKANQYTIIRNVILEMLYVIIKMCTVFTVTLECKSRELWL